MQNANRKIYILIAFILAAAPGVFAAGVRVSAGVDSEKDIYVGESFNYYISIEGENQPGQVDLAPQAKYNPQSAGNQDVSQTSISIINGKTSRNVVKKYVMSYSLTANQPGLIRLPPLSVTIAGKTYQTNPVDVNILKAGTTDSLDIQAELSEQQCYLGQPVILTVKFYIFADLGDFQFNVPAFTGDAFYLEDPDISDRQAKEFLVNNVSVLVAQQRGIHNGRDSVLLSFSKVLIPKQSGRIEIEPTTVSADVAVGYQRSGDRMFDEFFGAHKKYKRFMVNSSPLTLAVSPLPEESKPAQFYGLVGRYTISASAEPVKVNVGDPITLTIKVGGSKYLKPVQWPAIEQIPQLAENFKIPSQKATPTVENGFKVFTQTIRANNDKVTQIPPIPLPFFDADKGKYVIAETEPIKLEVAPTKILTNADLEGKDFTPVNKEVEAVRKGLSANYEGPDVLKNQSFSMLAAATCSGYTILWFVPLAGLITSLSVRLLTHTSPEKIALRRRRQACRKAVGQLKKIVSAPPKQLPELLAAIMKQYIGERFDRIAGTLTADDCRQVIIAAAQDSQTADRYSSILNQCEMAHYAPSESNIGPRQCTETIQLIRAVEKKTKK